MSLLGVVSKNQKGSMLDTTIQLYRLECSMCRVLAECRHSAI